MLDEESAEPCAWEGMNDDSKKVVNKYWKKRFLIIHSRVIIDITKSSAWHLIPFQEMPLEPFFLRFLLDEDAFREIMVPYP